ncbi:MAG: ABC transporter permease [Gammaproteobacteria bacterium]
MGQLALCWANLMRGRVRTVLTLVSIVIAFVLFGLLDAVRLAFSVADSVEGASRIIVSSRLSIIQPLPFSKIAAVQRVEGVQAVSWASWFGGIYQDRRNFFPNFAVGPNYFDLYPELLLEPGQREAFAATRTGAVAGQRLAERFGWKLGDRIPLEATIFPHRSGSNTWTFDLVGIYRARDAGDRRYEDQLMFRYDYFDEGRTFGNGDVGYLVVKIADPGRAAAIALAIDRLSANSDSETKSETERAFNLAFVKQVGDIGLIVSAIMAAVLFTILLVTGNTMAQAVRERTREIGVLKTLGFSDGRILALVLGESLLLVSAGAGTGLALSWAAVQGLNAAFSRGAFAIGAPTVAAAVGVAIALAIAVGLPPALRARRLPIVDALQGR